MGTSSPGSGPRSDTPLIPNWINQQDGGNSMEIPSGDHANDDANNISDVEPVTNQQPTVSLSDDMEHSPQVSTIPVLPNRFKSARRNFRHFTSDRVNNQSALHDALREYVRQGSGGSKILAIRMRPSASRLASFYRVANTIRTEGKTAALNSFHLQEYVDKSLIEVLSALTDIVFDTNSRYNDIQDDSITKAAYSNTINRLVEIEDIDLDHLSNENIAIMMAVFIEETIITRVICDIGTHIFTDNIDCEEALAIEETVYQIVHGFVRTTIMPEITATQLAGTSNLEAKIEEIYRIAFDCIAGTN